jgi:hypothetical protein
VNGTPIELDYFVAGFIHRVVQGMLESLRGTGPIESLELAIDERKQLQINLNNTVVPVKQFVVDIVSSTLIGMVATLKGVDQVDTLRLTIER